MARARPGLLTVPKPSPRQSFRGGGLAGKPAFRWATLLRREALRTQTAIPETRRHGGKWVRRAVIHQRDQFHQYRPKKETSPQGTGGEFFSPQSLCRSRVRKRRAINNTSLTLGPSPLRPLFSSCPPRAHHRSFLCTFVPGPRHLGHREPQTRPCAAVPADRRGSRCCRFSPTVRLAVLAGETWPSRYVIG